MEKSTKTPQKNNEATTSQWSEFEEALASGEDVDILLGLEEEDEDDEDMETSYKQKKNLLEESMKVTIGGEEFKLELSIPTLDEILMRNKDYNFADELLVPPPLVPMTEILPLKVLSKIAEFPCLK